MPEISNSELEVVRATAENARITADRAHRLAKGLDNEIHRVALGLEEVDRHQHWVVKLGIAVICLMALTGACAWWLNSELSAQGTSLANLLGIQKTVDNLTLRVNGTEAGLKVVAEQWQDKKVGEIGQAPATRTQTASAPPDPAPTTDRVGQLNETEVANLRRESTQHIEAVKSATAPEMARLQSVLDRNRAKIASLSNQVDRDRHDFEISQDRALEVVPGILLTIKETNVDRQEINGWVYLQGERRFQYLKNQGLLQPITVWSIQEQKAHDIVITKVGKGDALGFVLSPKTAEAVAVNGAN